jgi:superfamily I DNA/RNA helicase
VLTGHSDVVEATQLSSVFRSSRFVLDLAFSVTSGGATLFTNFEDPLRVAQAALTAGEESRAAMPTYCEFPAEGEMIEGAFRVAGELAESLEERRAAICIIVFSEPLFEEVRSFATKRNKPSEFLTKRGDAALVERAAQTNRFVVAGVDYVGGLEFSGVVLVGVDDGRVPPLSTASVSDSKNYLSYISHNRLYVAITRARYRVAILGVADRGPSSLLKNAFELNLLERV